MITGMTFLSMPGAFGEPPSPLEDINYVSLSDGVVDEILVTRKIYTSWDGTIPSEWEFETVIRALFQESLRGGNIQYAANLIQAIRLKVRESGTFEWRTIYEKPVNNEMDLNFEFYDPLNPSNTHLEYGYVPVINGSEGDMFTNDVISKFEGFFLIEKDMAYQAILNTRNQYSLNYKTEVLSPLGKRFPIVVKNGDSKYYSGILEATFIEQKDCDFDIMNGYKYRQKVEEFLTDGKPKILKDFEGKIWLVQIVDNVTVDSSSHYQNPIHSINWVQIGDEKSVADLYDNGFINTDVDRK